MKNYHLTFALAICSLLLTIILGCGDYYDEGNETAKQRFEKMTSQEKALYTSVEEIWGQKDLKTIRESVSRRETRPVESTLAFKDIAAVIKTNNVASLKLNDGWDTANKNKHIKARWDRIDENWYRDLLLSVGVREIIKQDLIPEEQVIDETLPESLNEINNDLKEINNYIEEYPEAVKVNSKDIIPEDKYDDLYYEIKRCPEAVEQYKQIVKERILTWADYELLTRISLKCKADETLKKLEM
jgi:hypothetical protein